MNCFFNEIERSLLQPDSEERGDIVLPRSGFERRYDSAAFTPTETEVIRAVAEKLGRKSAAELSRLTHKEDAWKETPDGKEISYHWARTLKYGV